MILDDVLVKKDQSEQQLNPLTDQGHSYSYNPQDEKVTKQHDNLLLIIPLFDEIISQFELIINEDQTLKEIIGQLSVILNQATTAYDNDFVNFKKQSQQLLSKIINLVQLDQEELTRIETESAVEIKDNKKDQLLKFKQKLQLFLDQYLEIY